MNPLLAALVQAGEPAGYGRHQGEDRRGKTGTRQGQAGRGCAVSGLPTAADVRHMLDIAQRDMLAALDKLAKDLPGGYTVSSVDVDVASAEAIAWGAPRRFMVAINIEVRV